MAKVSVSWIGRNDLNSLQVGSTDSASIGSILSAQSLDPLELLYSDLKLCPMAFFSSSNAHQQLRKSPPFPGGHNQAIINKCQLLDEALYYVVGTEQHGWSRNVLIHQIESGLYQREGKAITNFEQTLPPLQSDLAQQSFKDSYVY